MSSKAYAAPTFVPADLVARINAKLADELSPIVWGLPKPRGDTSTRWVNQPVVRKNKLIDLIGDVDGVDYVQSLSITGSAGVADSNGDLTLAGAIPLTLPGTFTGSAT